MNDLQTTIYCPACGEDCPAEEYLYAEEVTQYHDVRGIAGGRLVYAPDNPDVGDYADGARVLHECGSYLYINGRPDAEVTQFTEIASEYEVSA